jgi:DNA-binding winged helix-turn-helix (wHTH) protein
MGSETRSTGAEQARRGESAYEAWSVRCSCRSRVGGSPDAAHATVGIRGHRLKPVACVAPWKSSTSCGSGRQPAGHCHTRGWPQIQTINDWSRQNHCEKYSIARLKPSRYDDFDAVTAPCRRSRVPPFFQTFCGHRRPVSLRFCIICSSSMRSGSSVYRFGPFELDAPGARLFRGAARIPLPDSQFAILLPLVAHFGEVVSKEALAHAAWHGAAVTDNSLDQAISRLRKTLGDRRDRARYIETVPNRGYRFAAEIERTHRHEPRASTDLQLAPYRALVQGEDDLDTPDRDAIRRARREFEDVLRADPEHAVAHVNLANACAYAFESTRADIAPDLDALNTALEHSSKGCELAPRSADAWSTRAFVLCLNGDTQEAEAACGCRT